MTTALRRKLNSLRRLATHPATPEREAEAARLAEQRINDRLRDAGSLETLFEPETYDSPSHPGLSKRRARRKAAHERPAANRLHMGDLVDADMVGHPLWGPCRCSNRVFQVCPGIVGMSVALLVCTGCRRSRKLQKRHFEANGRYAD
jgi:hypothetical protein